MKQFKNLKDYKIPNLNSFLNSFQITDPLRCFRGCCMLSWRSQTRTLSSWIRPIIVPRLSKLWQRFIAWNRKDSSSPNLSKINRSRLQILQLQPIVTHCRWVSGLLFKNLKGELEYFSSNGMLSNFRPILKFDIFLSKNSVQTDSILKKKNFSIITDITQALHMSFHHTVHMHHWDHTIVMLQLHQLSIQPPDSQPLLKTKLLLQLPQLLQLHHTKLKPSMEVQSHQLHHLQLCQDTLNDCMFAVTK